MPGFSASLNSSSEDTALKLFAGTRLNEHYGFEGGYLDMGKVFEFDATVSGPETLDAHILAEVNGFYLAGTAELPINDLISLNGRIGVYLWNTDLEYRLVDSLGTDESDSGSDDGNDVFYGLGLDIGFIGIQYEFYEVDGLEVDYLGCY